MTSTQQPLRPQTGILHLIPVGLSDAPINVWQPEALKQSLAPLTTFIVENAKSARAFLKQTGINTPIQEIKLHVLKRDTKVADIDNWLSPLKNGVDIGLLSEAGCPAVADPGAQVVARAHQKNLGVKPWTGPSSILLALMASGLDGQRFAFHGYAPIDAAARATTLKNWEADSRRHQQTQILIETPYRNRAMFDTLLEVLNPNTRLCLACNLTGDNEFITTRTVANWKQVAQPDLHKQPCIFLFLA